MKFLISFYGFMVDTVKIAVSMVVIGIIPFGAVYAAGLRTEILADVAGAYYGATLGICLISIPFFMISQIAISMIRRAE